MGAVELVQSASLAALCLSSNAGGGVLVMALDLSPDSALVLGSKLVLDEIAKVDEPLGEAVRLLLSLPLGFSFVTHPFHPHSCLLGRAFSWLQGRVRLQGVVLTVADLGEQSLGVCLGLQLVLDADTVQHKARLILPDFDALVDLQSLHGPFPDHLPNHPLSHTQCRPFFPDCFSQVIGCLERMRPQRRIIDEVDLSAVPPVLSERWWWGCFDRMMSTELRQEYAKFLLELSGFSLVSWNVALGMDYPWHRSKFALAAGHGLCFTVSAHKGRLPTVHWNCRVQLSLCESPTGLNYYSF